MNLSELVCLEANEPPNEMPHVIVFIAADSSILSVAAHFLLLKPLSATNYR